MSTVAKTEFQKSLQRLEQLSKNQLFHTPSDSNPGQWAGSSPQDEDSMDDMIQENGTDYDGVKKALAQKVSACKALTPAEVKIVKGVAPFAEIGDKIAKGAALTAAEKWAIGPKGRNHFQKSDEMANSPKKDGAAEENKTARDVPDQNVADKNDGKKDEEIGMSKGDRDDDDDDRFMDKSFAATARQQKNLAAGIEMSPILHEMVVALDAALQGQSTRVLKSLEESLGPVLKRVKRLEKSLESLALSQDEFNKSMASAVVGIGEQVAGAAEITQTQANLPAAGPRTTFRPNVIQGGQGVQPIQKSFDGPGGLESGEGYMAKSQIVETMVAMVEAKKLNPTEVVRFESTGQLDPRLEKSIMAFAQGGGR